MKSLEELKAIRERMQGQVGLRSEDSSQTRVVVWNQHRDDKSGFEEASHFLMFDKEQDFRC